MRKISWALAGILIIGCITAVVLLSSGQERGSLMDADRIPDRGDDQTPRSALTSFLTDMIAVNNGDRTRLHRVLDLIDVPEFIPPDKRVSYALRVSSELFLVLSRLNFDLEEDVPGAAADGGDEVHFTLSDDSGTDITITMERTGEGHWHFAPDTYTSKAFREYAGHLSHLYLQYTRADMEGDTYVPELMSPYRTLLTLKAGVEALGTQRPSDAAQALDLSQISPLAREHLGPILAVYLYRVLACQSQLTLEQISADPDTRERPVFLVVPGMGAITMHAVEEDGLRAWKFTPESLELVWNIYDQAIAEQRSAGTLSLPGADLPLGVRLDDIIQRFSPRFTETVFGTEVYVVLALLFALALVPFLAHFTGVAMSWAVRRLRRVAPEEMREVRARRFSLPVIFLTTSLFLFATVSVLGVPEYLYLAAFYVFRTMFIISAVWFAWVVFEYAGQWLSAVQERPIRGTLVMILAQLAKIVALVTGVLQLAVLFGQDSSKIWAGIGIGGVALALAGKDTVENLFGTVMILTTKPFAVGDWIVMGDIDGLVEHVGMRSTAIRTFHDSITYVPNARFITNHLDNMGKRRYRRWKTMLSVAYDTPPATIEAFTAGIKRLARRIPLIRHDNMHIRVNEFAASSIDILLNIFFRTDDRTVELRERERLILEIMKLADELRVQFAFPTQTLYLRRDAPAPYHEWDDLDKARQFAADVADRISDATERARGKGAGGQTQGAGPSRDDEKKSMKEMAT